MSGLRDALGDYLSLRRSLGFKLERPGQLLEDFTGYLDAAGVPTVTTELALAWATAPADADPAWWRRGWPRPALSRATLPRSSPAPRCRPPGCCRPGFPRAVPYFYSQAGIGALITAAAAIRTPLRAAAYQTLIGLLAVTGMRAGETIRLDRPT